ncbi:DUF3604 domain-containing protein [Rhizobium sp. RCAM05350]|nr:DUF3604 domain-containing protein [Rhizobium sp. RCAM05350]
MQNGNASTKPHKRRALEESHPFLSPNDEFAWISKPGTRVIWTAAFPRQKEMLEFEYVRSAYKNGLKLEKQFGTNPYKFGLINSSDAHTGPDRDGGGQLLRQNNTAGTKPASHDGRLYR